MFFPLRLFLAFLKIIFKYYYVLDMWTNRVDSLGHCTLLDQYQRDGVGLVCRTYPHALLILIYKNDF